MSIIGALDHTGIGEVAESGSASSRASMAATGALATQPKR